ncbi:MAG: hypothetical protein Q7J34_14545 [Bacteroidales bacterium]|nr:hypothetical protein [Bacteroidales bacterium]
MKKILLPGLINRRVALWLLIATGSLMMSSCYKGLNGLDGRAFMSLNYEKNRPSLIDAGTASIPNLFEWGRFYEAQAGWYYLYYEGSTYSPYGIMKYAWQLEYEIYRIQGEPGGWGYDGEDAPDALFTLLCRPEGPSFIEQNIYKQSEIQSDSVYTLETHSQGYELRVKARKCKVEN